MKVTVSEALEVTASLNEEHPDPRALLRNSSALRSVLGILQEQERKTDPAIPNGTEELMDGLLTVIVQDLGVPLDLFDKDEETGDSSPERDPEEAQKVLFSGSGECRITGWHFEDDAFSTSADSLLGRGLGMQELWVSVARSPWQRVNDIRRPGRSELGVMLRGALDPSPAPDGLAAYQYEVRRAY